MKIYIGHSKHFDYRNELYLPLRRSRLNREHTIIFPHEDSEHPYNSKRLFQSHSVDLMVAEVSFGGKGVFIEMGWADMLNIPIIAMHLKSISPSDSVRQITRSFVAYENPDDMVRKLEEEIGKMRV